MSVHLLVCRNCLITPLTQVNTSPPKENYRGHPRTPQRQLRLYSLSFALKEREISAGPSHRIYTALVPQLGTCKYSTWAILSCDVACLWLLVHLCVN